MSRSPGDFRFGSGPAAPFCAAGRRYEGVFSCVHKPHPLTRAGLRADATDYDRVVLPVR